MTTNVDAPALPREVLARAPDEKPSWLASGPFLIMHLLPLAAFFTGTHWVDWVVCLVLYYVRMFGITAGYHRYFAHRSYKMGRVTQFLVAILAMSSAQKGVLWWAAHHRHHHKHSDQQGDVHSPKKGYWWSHMGWILCTKYESTDSDRVRDLAKYPELVWLNRHWLFLPSLLGFATWLVGGWSMLLIGFFLSTVLLYHGTFLVNSVAHIFGSRRFETTDTSRNSLIVALLTCGEGWHNNHHHYMSSAKQGFYWWEIDLSYYGIKLMEQLGLAWDVRTPPKEALARNRIVARARDVVIVQELSDAE